MSMLTATATDWLRAHGGTITNDALEAAGISVTQRERLVERRILRRVIVGVYQFTGVELDESGRCIALCTGRSDMVIAGPTAARHWGLRRAGNDGLVHAVAPPHSNPCRISWLRVFRTDVLDDTDVVRLPDGRRVTSPPATVVLMARHLPDAAVTSMIDDAIAKGQCTEGTLRRVAERFASPGRPWAARFLRLLDRRRPGRPGDSDPERDVHDLLCERGVEGLVRQWPQWLPDYGPARFDIAIPDLRWALEVDIHPEHRTVEGIARDNRRDAAAAAIGIDVRRVSEGELDDDLEGTLASVMAEIDRRRAEIASRRDPDRR